VKLTYDDLLFWPDDGRRHELIDGERYVTPSANLRHQRISGHLYLALRRYLEEHPLGEVLYTPLDVLFSQHDVVEPDTEYWVVDPEIDVVRVDRRDGDTFARPVELRRDAGDALATVLLPGLTVPLDAIFAA